MVNTWEWRLTWFPRLDEQDEYTEGVSIENFSDVQVVRTSEDNRDSFSFRVKRGNPILDLLDFRSRIVFEKRVNDEDFVKLFTGIVESVPSDFGGTEERVTIEGSDASKTVLDSVVFLDATELRLDEALEQALETISNYARDDFPITWSSSNPSTTSDGEPFPVVGEKWFYKPMRDILRIYSGDSYTSDGRYEYFVDFDDEFIWRPYRGSVQGEISPDTVRTTKFESDRNSDEVVNFVIVKMGNLPTSRSVEEYDINFGSAGKHGIRLEVETVDSQEVITKHNEAMDELGLFGSGKVLPADDDLSDYAPPWGGSSVDSREEYEESLLGFAKERARQIAQSIVDSGKRGRKEFKITVPSYQGVTNGNFGLGEVFTVGGFPDVRVTECRVTRQDIFGSYETFTLLERKGSI